MKNKIYNIKGMVCSRCLKVLKNELNALGVTIKEIRIGYARLEIDEGKIEEQAIEKVIKNNGFEIIRSTERILAEQTKIDIINFVQHTEMTKNLSTYLEKNIGKSYQVLSRNFSKIFGQTIERFLLKLKIEKVKESIDWGADNFSQIAYSMGYESLSSLSRQFKKETGMSMKHYQKMERRDRVLLDEML